MESESIAIWNMIAQWMGAIGTIGATIAALYFAQKNNRFKLDLFAEKAVLISENGDNLDVLTIEITNLSYRKVILTQLYWKIPFKKGSYPLLYNGENSLNNKLPLNLDIGEVFSFNTPLNHLRRMAITFVAESNYCPSLLVKLIKFGAYSSTKKEFEVRIGKELQKWILSQKYIFSSR